MRKEPLYRKVNSKARGCHHSTTPDAKHNRNTKTGMSNKMKKDIKHGLDYTPLYKFLHSKVGQDFNTVYSEAIDRIDDAKAIYHIIDDTCDFVRIGECSYYSTLKIDENNILQLTNPSLKNEDFTPGCSCCTHTFNGKVLTRKYSIESPSTIIRVL